MAWAVGGFVLGIIPQKRCFKFLFFFAAKIVQKMEKPTPRMDEFTHKMEDSTMKHKTPILEQNNLSFMGWETKI